MHSWVLQQAAHPLSDARELAPEYLLHVQAQATELSRPRHLQPAPGILGEEILMAPRCRSRVVRSSLRYPTTSLALSG